MIKLEFLFSIKTNLSSLRLKMMRMMKHSKLGGFVEFKEYIKIEFGIKIVC